MNVLLVAYYYPPLGSGGTERPAKMAKYLARLGHAVSVVTCTDGADVVRVPELRFRDISHNCHRVGWHRIQWIVLRSVSGGLNEIGVYHSIYSYWRNRVLRAAARVVKQALPDVILATYPPVENLEIGLTLAGRYDVPLVSDYRDGQLFEPVERDRLARYECVRRHYRRIELAVAERSAAVVTAFPSVTEYFRNEYGLARVTTITNGYDDDDYLALEASHLLDPGKINIVHTGRFGGSYSGRDVRPLRDALQRLSSTDPEFVDRVRLHLIGPLERHERELFSNLINLGVVRVHGLCSRSTALASQVAADALLLLTATDRPGNAPGKLFEYLRAGKPIIGLTTRSYSEQVIRETGTGWTVDPGDADAIEDALREVNSPTDRTWALTPDTARIEEFSRERQVARLATLLESVPR